VSRCNIVHPDRDEKYRRYQDQIAELEAACRIALDTYARVSNVRLPGDVAGALVHARETLRRAIGQGN
jgi:hypothetical protein